MAEINLGKVKGEDGSNVYIKYNTTPSDTGATDTWSGERTYIGVLTSTLKTKPTTGYIWSKFVGDGAVIPKTSQVLKGDGVGGAAAVAATVTQFVRGDGSGVDAGLVASDDKGLVTGDSVYKAIQSNRLLDTPMDNAIYGRRNGEWVIIQAAPSPEPEWRDLTIVSDTLIIESATAVRQPWKVLGAILNAPVRIRFEGYGSVIVIDWCGTYEADERYISATDGYGEGSATDIRGTVNLRTEGEYPQVVDFYSFVMTSTGEITLEPNEFNGWRDYLEVLLDPTAWNMYTGSGQISTALSGTFKLLSVQQYF